MISFDTNLLRYSLNRDCAEYEDARRFFAVLPTTPGAVAVCELVLPSELSIDGYGGGVPGNAARFHSADRQPPCWRRLFAG